MLDFFQKLPSMLDAGPQVGWLEALKLLLGAFVFGQVIAWTYEKTFTGLSYSRNFAQAMVLTAVAACVFVMAIGRSIYAGLGLLGILSIIRFRSTLKAPRDLVFLMAAASFGVTAGIDALVVGAAGAVAFCGVALYLHYGPFGAQQRFDGILRFSTDAAAPVGTRLQDLLSEHCSRSALLSVGEVAQGMMVEHTYQVKFLSDRDRPELLDGLRRELRAKDVRLLLQEVTLEY